MAPGQRRQKSQHFIAFTNIIRISRETFKIMSSGPQNAKQKKCDFLKNPLSSVIIKFKTYSIIKKGLKNV